VTRKEKYKGNKFERFAAALTKAIGEEPKPRSHLAALCGCTANGAGLWLRGKTLPNRGRYNRLVKKYPQLAGLLGDGGTSGSLTIVALKAATKPLRQGSQVVENPACAQLDFDSFEFGVTVARLAAKPDAHEWLSFFERCEENRGVIKALKEMVTARG